MTDVRASMIKTYAGWTALSALRSGAPVKDRAAIYPLLRAVQFHEVLGAEFAAISRPWPALSFSEYLDVYAVGSAIGSTITGACSTRSCVSANQASARVVCQNLGTASPLSTTKCTPWL